MIRKQIEHQFLLGREHQRSNGGYGGRNVKARTIADRASIVYIAARFVERQLGGL
jgi:hypothetical protein